MSSERSESIIVVHEPVALDARTDELDALVQLREISAALRELGCQTSSLAIDLDFAAALRELKGRSPDCVFNLVESLGGSGQLIHLLPALLSSAGIAFTGSGADAIYMSSQKLLAKRWMALHGIPTPRWHTAEETVEDDDQAWIVKSVWEHASLGLDHNSVVRGPAAMKKRLADCKAQFGGEWFAERYIDGREFNISMLEDNGEVRVLPIAEISFDGFPAGKPKIVGYDAKWNEDSVEYHTTARTFPDLAQSRLERLLDVVRQCWRIFRLRGYARVDIRMDDRGVPWVLEINANPCLSKDAGFVAAAERAGLSYEHVIQQILDSALRSEPLELEPLT